MAEEPETNEAFLREVDDELRRSELEAFWKKWGRWLIGGTLASLALFGGWLYWQDQQRKAAGIEAEKLSAALEDARGGRIDEAAKQIDGVATSTSDGYRASALFAKAGIALQKGDVKAAIASYATIAGDANVAEPWRNLALVRQTALEFDGLKPELIIQRLEKLAVKGNPWFGSAGEMVAIAYLKHGKPKLAGKIFNEIGKDEQVPESIRARTVQLASAIEALPGGATTETQAK